MKKLLLLIIVSLMLAGVASARTVWRPASIDPNFPVAVANWNVAENWDNGVPTSALLTGEPASETGKAVFYHPTSIAECRVTTTPPDEVCAYFVLADNEPMVSPLVIMEGATLTATGNASSWCAIGYNSTGAHVIVERGATLDLNTHLYVGMNTGATDSRLVINGGTVLVADVFRYGRQTGSAGYVDLNAGLFEARYLNSDSGPFPGSRFDIKFGKYRLTGGENNDRDRLQRDIDDGYCVAWGGAGTAILAEEANGDWFVTASSDPLARYPTMDEWVAYDPTLSWVNLAAVPPATNVWVDVWFGTDTDPCSGYTKVVGTLPGVTSAGVTTPADDEYVWQINSYLHGDPAHGQYNYGNDPNLDGYSVDEGVVMYFNATNDFEPVVVIDTNPTATWKGEPIPLQATVYDEGASAVTATWTSSVADPNVTFSTPETVIPIQADYTGTGVIVTTNVTVNYNHGPFTVTVTASDSSSMGPGGSDTVGLDCRNTPCGAARNGVGLSTTYPADVAIDCDHDLADFAVIAGDWLDDYALKVPIEIP